MCWGPQAIGLGASVGGGGAGRTFWGGIFRALLGTAFPAGTPRLPAFPRGAAVGVGRRARPRGLGGGPGQPAGPSGSASSSVSRAGRWQGLRHRHRAAAEPTRRAHTASRAAPGTELGRALSAQHRRCCFCPSFLPARPRAPGPLRHPPPATWAAVAVVQLQNPSRSPPPFPVPPLTRVPGVPGRSIPTRPKQGGP